MLLRLHNDVENLVSGRFLPVLVILGAVAMVDCGPAEPPPPPPDAGTAMDLPVVQANDNTEPGGRMVGDTLVLELELVQAAWTPRGPDGPRVPVPVFQEMGGEPRVPAPLLRTTVGTPVRLTIHNRLEQDARVQTPLPEGGELAGGNILNPGVGVEAGASRTVTFQPSTPVTSVYRAFIREVGGRQGTMSGVVVVDPADAPVHPDERILHIESWGHRSEPGSLSSDASWKLTVNGRSWPFTERFDVAVGDTVRWRVVNSSAVRHPMHLHGFFFDVTSAGDLRADTVFDPGHRAPVVTHAMLNESAMTLRWIPEEPGNWIFHCHLMRHMGPGQRFASEGELPTKPGGAATNAMAGLISGITVRPMPRDTVHAPDPARRIDLWTAEEPGGYGEAPRLAFVEQRGTEAPPLEDDLGASSTLVLRRGEPTEIVVHNRLDVPLSVHWHGLELASLYDGVGDWSGMPGMTRPPIEPGGSATVLLTPPRAGTFMYHTHGETGHELAQGLYGTFLVLEPDAEWDPEQDRVYLLGAGGGTYDPPPAVNGVLEPEPEHFMAGRSYRLRFAQIAPDESKVVRLLRDGEPVTWTPVAKDGADLTAAQQIPSPARLRAEVGETFDVRWTPEESGIYQLEVKTVAYPLDGEIGPTQTVAFAVGEVAPDAVAEANAGFRTPFLTPERQGYLILAGIAAVLLTLLGGIGWGLWRTLRWWRGRRAVVS